MFKEVHSDKKGIPGIGAIGSQFKGIFIRLDQFLTGFIFLEAITTYFAAGLLHSRQKKSIIVTVEGGKEIFG